MKNENRTYFFSLDNGLDAFDDVLFSGERDRPRTGHYVNPYIKNISHMLAPTYPTMHLPNSMMRVFPVCSDFAGYFR